MTLYELTEEFRALTETWDDTITDEEFMQKMADLNANFDAKIKNCAFYVKNLEGELPAIDAEIKRLQTMKKSAQNKIDGIKKYMLDNMTELRKTDFDFTVIKVRLQNNPPKVNFIDTDIIPDRFKTETVSISIDKKAIKEAGGCIGAEIVQEQSVRIK